MTDLRFELPEINTWRLFNKSVTQRGVVEMVESWESHGYRFGSVCIDDGWTTDGRLGDWTPDPVRFPDMRGLVEWIHSKGYAARLWIAPSQCHPDTMIHKQAFPEAMLVNPQGQPSYFSGLGTYRLDPRHAIASEHIRTTMQRLVMDYGVDAFKVDFPPFLEPYDDAYKFWKIHLDDETARTMVPDFYKLIRQAVDDVKPDVRICCAKDIANCQPYIDDTICGDFVLGQRTDDMIVGHAQKVNEYVKGHKVTPWLEMVWGGGTDTVVNNPEWHTGFIEFIAHSINHNLKIEHSFYPFDYPNAEQIRVLTNLYGPRNKHYKVLAAGNKVFMSEAMEKQGVEMDHKTRFLVATENDTLVTLQVGHLDTSALQWHCRELLTEQPIRLISKNEYWSGTMKYCRAYFEAKGKRVYEMWHEGPQTTYYHDLHDKFVRPWLETKPV